MKKLIASSLALSALALAAGVATAAITNTPHNLSTGGSGPNHTNAGSGTGQICVFCHTPHGSNTAIPAPLWNKGTPSTTYTTYAQMNSSTIDGKMVGVGSVSAACLSCHDGSQAMDNMLNAPGSGGYNASGATQSYGWTGNSTISGVANLGSDLRNDHPIGIQYCGGGISGSGTGAVTGSCNDKDFESAGLYTKTINGNQVFWLDRSGGTAGVREKTDIIFYTRAFSGTNALVGPSVECASCHDPHVSKTENGTSDVNFMRVTTTGSQICLACHTK